MRPNVTPRYMLGADFFLFIVSIEIDIIHWILHHVSSLISLPITMTCKENTSQNVVTCPVQEGGFDQQRAGTAEPHAEEMRTEILGLV